jgi:hypothetical protein
MGTPSTMTPESYSLNKQRVTLYAVMNIGASGAVTLQAWTPTAAQVTGAYSAAASSTSSALSPGGAQGIQSVSKESTAGQYTVALQDTYQRLLGVRATSIVATTGIPAAPDVGVVKPSGVNGLTTQNTVVVQFSAAGVATDPASGEQILLEITLDKSGVI